MASRYWVGGTATWDATVGTKWALTSGGAGGQTVPGASDDVFFDAASGAVTCTWSATSATVLSINCTGFTGTLATGGNSKTLAGTTTLWTSPVTCTITGAPTMTASSTAVGTRTVTCNHASPSAANSVNFTHTVGSSQTVVFSGTGFGALSLGFTGVIQGSPSVYGGIFVGPTGSSAANFNPTLLATGTLTTGVTRTIGNVTVNAPGATVTVNGATLGVANTFTLTAGTISLGGLLSAGIFSSSNTNTRAIAFSTNNIALTSTTAATTVLSMASATGFTFTGTGGFTRNMAATATVSFGNVDGGSTTNAPNLTVNGGASALAISNNSYFKNLIFTGSTSTVTASILNMAGNLTLASGGTYTAVVPTFVASGTITSAGKTLGNSTINGTGITVTLADAMTLGSTNTLTLTQGTFTAANFNVTVGYFYSASSDTRTLNMGSGTWTISVSSGVAWNTASITGMTLNPSTSTITMTSASSKTFLGGGLTYYNLNQGGAGTLTISGSNTFNNITNTVQPNTVTFTAGTTQTVSNFSLSGTVGNLITINSATPGTQATLSKASGTVSVSYVSIQDSNATGGATWLAAVGNGNVDAGNNLGWIFITDVTVPVTNVLATGDVGSVLLGARTKAITNVLATGAVGTVNSERAKAITNVLATGDVGTMESGYASLVTGVLATGDVGTVGFGYAFPVTGVLATGDVGTVNSERDKAITNVLATGDVGAVGFGYAFPVTGVLATGAVGFMYPSWIPIPTGQTPVWVAVGTPQTPTWYNVTTGQTPVWVAVGTPQTPTWGDVDTDQTSTWTDIIQQ